MAFQKKLEYRNADGRVICSNNLSTSCRNLVSFGPVTPEFMRLTVFWGENRQELAYPPTGTDEGDENSVHAYQKYGMLYIAWHHVVPKQVTARDTITSAHLTTDTHGRCALFFNRPPGYVKSISQGGSFPLLSLPLLLRFQSAHVISVGCDVVVTSSMICVLRLTPATLL